MSTVVIHRYEPDAVMHWLEFPDKPDAATRGILKAAGWRFIGAVMQWRHAGLLTPLPELPGYTYEEGGEVDYSQARVEHYETSAQKAEARRATAHQKADSIADMIPFGQPILVGHHSERRHRRDLAKIDRNMQTAIEEGKKAEHLRGRAEASLAQQERKHDPGAIYRRLVGVRKDYRIYEHAASAEGSRRRDLLAAEISRLETELEAVGGLPADRVKVEKGDIIRIHGFLMSVKRVNPTSFTCLHLHPSLTYVNGQPIELKLDRSYFTERLYTAAEWKNLSAEQQAELLKY
jgi:hypothetical protein